MGNSDDYSGYNYSIELQLAGLSYGGTPLTPFQAARLGRTICSKRMAGYTEDQVVDDAEINGPMNSEQAVQTVLGGEYDFCYAYEHDGSIGRGSRPSPPPLQTLEPNPPGPPPGPPAQDQPVQGQTI